MAHTSATFLRRKKRSRQNNNSPFPVPIGTITGSQPKPADWQYYTGYLQGDRVVVHHTGDINHLYKMGFFGKGLHSRGAPELQSNLPSVHIPRGSTGTSDVVKAIRCRRYLTHCYWQKIHDHQSTNQQREPEDLEYDSDGDLVDLHTDDPKQGSLSKVDSDNKSIHLSAKNQQEQASTPSENIKQDDDKNQFVHKNVSNLTDQEQMDDSSLSDTDFMPITFTNLGNSKKTEEEWDSMQADEDFWGCASESNTKHSPTINDFEELSDKSNETKHSLTEAEVKANISFPGVNVTSNNCQEHSGNSNNTQHSSTEASGSLIGSKAISNVCEKRSDNGSKTADHEGLVTDRASTACDDTEHLDSSKPESAETCKNVKQCEISDVDSADMQHGKKMDSADVDDVDRINSESTGGDGVTSGCDETGNMKESLNQFTEGKSMDKHPIVIANDRHRSVRCMAALLMELKEIEEGHNSGNGEVKKLVENILAEAHSELHDLLDEKAKSEVDDVDTKNNDKTEVSDSTDKTNKETSEHLNSCCDASVCDLKLLNDLGFDKILLKSVRKEIIKHVIKLCDLFLRKHNTCAQTRTGTSEAAKCSSGAMAESEQLVGSSCNLTVSDVESDHNSRGNGGSCEKIPTVPDCKPCPQGLLQGNSSDTEQLMKQFFKHFYESMQKGAWRDRKCLHNLRRTSGVSDTVNKACEHSNDIEDVNDESTDVIMMEAETREVEKVESMQIEKSLPEGLAGNIDIAEETQELVTNKNCEGSSKDLACVSDSVELPTKSKKPFHPYSEHEDVTGDYLVIDDSDCDDQSRPATLYQWRPVRKQDTFPMCEPLMLSAEEAFFLSYGLGCLTVMDAQQSALSLTELWNLFSGHPRFLPRYIAYHFIRSRGWVPRAGILFGADFIVYKEGPPFLHSSYSVVVKAVEEDTLREISMYKKRDLTWTTLAGLDRVTEHVSKKLMFCYVLMPKDLTDEDKRSPQCISRCKVRLQMVNRWVSSQDKDKEAEEDVL